jgi:hypothetical protein
MKRTFVTQYPLTLFWGILLLGAQLVVPSAGAVVKPSSVKQALIDIERRIGEANLNCDYKYFAIVEADEFIFTDSNGSVTTRAQDLAGEATCKKSTSTYDVDETNVWLNGNTAVVTGRVTIRKSLANPGPVNRSRFTDVFVFRDKRWQLVAGHSSRIRESPPPPAPASGGSAPPTNP